MDEVAPRWTSSTIVRAGLVGVVVLAAIAGIITAAAVLDRRTDRVRPMFHDVLLVAGFEYDVLANGRHGVHFTATSESGPVRIGRHRFVVRPGVTVTVEKRGDSYCVKGADPWDETDWLCVNGKGDRPSLGTLG